jgi:hypothetical protein
LTFCPGFGFLLCPSHMYSVTYVFTVSVL